MPWSHLNLWNKSKTYLKRGFSEKRESDLFYLWLSLGLELLGRATLAEIHPTLLADPQTQKGDNLLYALGFPSGKSPKSVSINVVFDRCKSIIPEYTKNEFDFCIEQMGKRNAELHSGESPFTEETSSTW